jgi:FkbH-like protein
VAEHPEMLLRHDHVAVFVANWSDKASNIREIARSLDLGLDAMVFVDDNAVERAWVREALPEVMVPEVGSDPAHYPRIIVASGAFEHLLLNGDDLARAGRYHARARQVQFVAEAGDYQSYLRSLDMRMTITPFDRIGRARIAQLIAKSNQFNLTTRRYSDVMVEQLEKDPAYLTWQVRLVDRLTDKGKDACINVDRSDPHRWRIDTWLMSCRVLERGVEQTIMNSLVAQARASGAITIRGQYIPTSRNKLVEEFFDRMKYKLLGSDADTGAKHYELAIADYEPFGTAIEVSP